MLLKLIQPYVRTYRKGYYVTLELFILLDGFFPQPLIIQLFIAITSCASRFFPFNVLNKQQVILNAVLVLCIGCLL